MNLKFLRDLCVGLCVILITGRIITVFSSRNVRSFLSEEKNAIEKSKSARDALQLIRDNKKNSKLYESEINDLKNDIYFHERRIDSTKATFNRFQKFYFKNDY